MSKTVNTDLDLINMGTINHTEKLKDGNIYQLSYRDHEDPGHPAISIVVKISKFDNIVGIDEIIKGSSVDLFLRNLGTFFSARYVS